MCIWVWYVCSVYYTCCTHDLPAGHNGRKFCNAGHKRNNTHTRDPRRCILLLLILLLHCMLCAMSILWPLRRRGCLISIGIKHASDRYNSPEWCATPSPLDWCGHNARGIAISNYCVRPKRLTLQHLYIAMYGVIRFTAGYTLIFSKSILGWQNRHVTIVYGLYC